jgi:hypothetical protein
MNYEITLRGDTYIDIAQLARTPPFTTYFVMQYKKHPEEHDALIEDNKKVNNTFYKKYDGKIKDLIDRVRNAPHPPVITDEELVIFKDALEESYETAMQIVVGDVRNKSIQIAKMQYELCRAGSV